MKGEYLSIETIKRIEELEKENKELKKKLEKKYVSEDIDKILKDNLSEYHYKIVKEYYGE